VVRHGVVRHGVVRHGGVVDDVGLVVGLVVGPVDDVGLVVGPVDDVGLVVGPVVGPDGEEGTEEGSGVTVMVMVCSFVGTLVGEGTVVPLATSNQVGEYSETGVLALPKQAAMTRW
jgi:Na+-transporting NADH:ubiquinone oxidoreductase subunit NqrD